jgi:hypothetical protein
MQKIISLFKRDYEGNRQVYDEVVDGAEWVLKGEGIPTQKFDGTCCLVQDGKLFKRYEVKRGKTAPANFMPANDVDVNTGKQQGWLPITNDPQDKYHAMAWDGYERCGVLPSDGTYELLGPKVQGNPEALRSYELIRHGSIPLADCPRTFSEIKDWLRDMDIEGIVWHHPDGRMVKIKKKDFGLKRHPNEKS